MMAFVYIPCAAGASGDKAGVTCLKRRSGSDGIHGWQAQLFGSERRAGRRGLLAFILHYGRGNRLMCLKHPLSSE